MDEPEDLQSDVAEGAEEQGLQVDEHKLEALKARMMAEQSIPRGLLAGIIAGLAAAFIWGLITKITEYEIGWIAIGVGFLVGISVRKFGKGLTPPFQIMGAVIAGLSVALGKVVAACMLASAMMPADMPMGAWELFTSLSIGDMIDLLKESFHGIDLLFYGFAVWEGWQFALRQITQEEMTSVLKLPE